MVQNINEIWERVVGNDRDAWNRLVRQFAPLVSTVARNVGLSPLDIEDCVQQTWLALYRNRRRIEDPARLPVWLIRTTHRRAVRMFQQASRRGQIDLESQPEPTATLPDHDILRLERQAILEVALQQLDSRCARLLRHLFLDSEKTSYRDIAKQLGLSVNALGPLRLRCLNKLRKILDNMGFSLH